MMIAKWCIGWLMVGVLMFGAGSSWADTETVDGVAWGYTLTNGMATVTGVEPAVGALTIPAELGGVPVTCIASNAFNGCDELTNIVISDGVTNIGQYAFGKCTGLLSVTIPDSVKAIQWSAFSQCKKLAAVYIHDLAAWCEISFDSYADTNPLEFAPSLFVDGSKVTDLSIPEGVTRIRYKAFDGCRNFASVTIPPSVTNIWSRAFFGCSGLTALRIPEGTTAIGGYAFNSCSGLTSLVLPATVKGIGREAFAKCPGLKHIEVASGNTEYESDGDVLFTKGKGGLILCAGGNEGDYAIPEGVTRIWTYAFYGCKRLTGISIPCGVTNIDSYAFVDCKGLKTLTIPESVTKVGTNAFTRSGVVTLYVPGSWEGTTMLTQAGVPKGCEVVYGIRLETGIEDGVTWTYSVSNGMATVRGAEPSTGTLIIPSELGGVPVTGIGNKAFYGCVGLMSVTIPESVTSVGSDAFAGCSGLKWLIVSATWRETAKLDDAGVPSECSVCYGISPGTETVDGVVWSYITSNGTATVTGAEPSEGELTIPAELGGVPVTGIGERAFSNCSGLTRVTIGNGVTSIGDQAFYGCNGLTSMTIPDSVASIGDGVFLSCHSLANVTIGNGVTSIAWAAFRDCSSLTSVAIPDGVRSIDPYAFADCTSLTNVTIGNGVESIGSWVFSWCTGLTTLTIPDSVTNLMMAAFNSCSLETLYVPASWEGTDMLADAELPSGCEVVYRGEGAAKHPITVGDGVEMVHAGNGEPRSEAAAGEMLTVKLNWPAGMQLVGVYVNGARIEGTTFTMPAESVTVTAEFTSCTAAVTIGGKVHQWDGAPHGVEVATVPAGLAVDVTYDGKGAPPSAAGVYDVVATVADGFYEGSARGTLVIVEPGEYLAVDMAGGADAAGWPVTVLDAVPEGGWTDEYKTTKLVLRKVEAGTFAMGSPTGELGRYADEVQHVATISRPFYVGVFEVTQKQWELAMGSNPSCFTNAACQDTRPVEQVSYSDIRGSSAGEGWPGSATVDAASFLGRLREKTAGLEFDLPTEAQWEYACRAGTATALNSGKDLTGTNSCPNMEEVGRYVHGFLSGNTECSPDSDTSAGTAEVGSCLPNAWGVYDMHGNVWEWCLDWYGSPATNAVTDPAGAASGSMRVLRGGSWHDGARSCRSANRGHHDPSAVGYYRGFRLVCPATAGLKEQEIDWALPGTGHVPGDRVALSATASGGGEVLFEVLSGPGVVEGRALVFTAAGTVTVRAYQPGDAAWLPVEETRDVSVPAAAADGRRVYADLAANYRGGWEGGTNGGDGFGAWRFDVRSGGGQGWAGGGIWDPSANNFAGTWEGKTNAFGLVGKGSGYSIQASRSFMRALAPGESFSLEMAVNWDSNMSGSRKGFALTAGGDDIVVVNHGSYPGNISVNGSTNYAAVNIYGLHPMTWTFTVADANTVQFVATARDNPANAATGTLKVVTSAIDGFRLQSVEQYALDENMWEGDCRQSYYDDFRLFLKGGDGAPSTADGVPHAWLEENAAAILAACGGDHEAAAKAAAANGMPVWACYVAGLSPTDEAAAFKIKSFTAADGAVAMKWEPDLAAERTYVVEGKASMEDEWGLQDAASRFFRVRVELPE